MHARTTVQRLVVFLCFAGLLAAPLSAADWPALIPGELAATAAQIDAEAGAEILASEVMIDDHDRSGMRINHYVRVKVFTKAGAEKMAKVEIPYDRAKGSVREIEARTIKPDGTILTLNSKEVFDREIVKAGDLRGRVKSFAPPGVEPGVMVEYRYRIWSDRRSPFFPMPFQSDLPARSVVYRFRPLEGVPGLSLRSLFLNTPLRELKPDRAGYYEFAMTNIRARKEEPLAPPRIHLTPSVLLYYSADDAKTPDEYWAAISEALDTQTKSAAKPTKAIKAEAQRLLAAGGSDEEKLRVLHDFCRSRIVNVSRVTRDKTARRPAVNDDAGDTLKQGIGTSADVNRLFVALARAAGFDAQLALANDRSTFVFQHHTPVPFAFTSPVAAVRSGGAWSYYDPGATYLPAGMIDWRNGDTAAIIANPKVALIERTQSAPGDRSFRRKTAALTLSEDGTLEGEVTFEYSGYFEAAIKNDFDTATPEEIEKQLLATLEPQLKGAELTAIDVRHASSPLEPIKVSFHLRVPDFAERTGARLFVQPAVFRRNAKALFEAATRETTMIFPHRRQDFDEVTLSLPEGVTIEAASAPLGLDLGSAGKYDVDISWRPTARVLHYRRTFRLNVIGFPTESYPKVKQIFETIQERDNHTLTFRFGAAPAEKS